MPDSRLLLPVALALGACAPPSEPTSTEPRPAPVEAQDAAPSESAVPPIEIAPGDYVLLWGWAELRAALPEGAELGRALPGGADRWTRAGAEMWVMRAIEQHGEWLEVQTIEASGDHCVGANYRLVSLDLRLFVRVEDIAPVLTRPVEVEVDEAQAVTLGEGVPVFPVEPGGVLTNLLLPVEIPVDAVGHSYAHPGRRDQGPNVEGALLGDTLALGTKLQLPLRWTDTLLEVGEAEDGWRTIRLGQRCAEYHLRIPAERYSPQTPDVWGGLSGTMRRGAQVLLPVGATLTWPDGSPAGTTRSALRVNDETLVADTEDGRRCFAHSITAGGFEVDDGALTLCFDATVGVQE